MLAEPLTRWSIRLALALYVVFLAGRLTAADPSVRRRWERPVWTLACLSFLVHLAAAMHFYHGWSNSAAILDTARQTEALFGVRFGEGIYFSYAFALLWTADVAWWWIRPRSYIRRNQPFSLLIHTYLFFIAFNGAIVFESGPTRWVGIPATLGLALLLARRLLAGRPLRNRPPLPVRSTETS